MPAAHYLINIFYHALTANTLENFTCRTEKYVEIIKSNKYYPAYSESANSLYKLDSKK
jgi:hypothetical protein